MNTKGFVQIPRSILDNEDYYRDRFSRIRAYIDLFFLAAYDERSFFIRGNKVTVKRGQIAVSVRNLCNRWNISNGTVINYLREFEKEGKITIKRSNVVNIITLVNDNHSFVGKINKDNNYKQLLESAEWQKKRNSILERDSYTCQLCGNNNKSMHVHHRYYIKGKMPWEYPDEALITLCKECHSKISKPSD